MNWSGILICRRPTRRGGFTLIEMLVVVSIIGLLTALTMVALQQSRETANLVQCRNHLRQIGIALQQHVGIHQVYPSPTPGRRVVPGPKGLNGQKYVSEADPSGFYDLLVSLEQVNLYNAINLYSAPPVDVTGLSFQNGTARSVVVDVFLCPSDSNRPDPKLGPLSYRFNVGVVYSGTIHSGFVPLPPLPGDFTAKKAAFNSVRRISDRDISDGLSQTIGISERRLGSGSSFKASSDFWYASTVPFLVPRTANELSDICGGIGRRPSVWDGTFGASWMGSMYQCTWYNHVMPPNSSRVDCTASNIAFGPDLNYTSVAARSVHNGGVHSLFMDGSVRFMKNGINLAVWRALSTRSSGEVISTSDL